MGANPAHGVGGGHQQLRSGRRTVLVVDRTNAEGHPDMVLIVYDIDEDGRLYNGCLSRSLRQESAIRTRRATVVAETVPIFGARP